MTAGNSLNAEINPAYSQKHTHARSRPTLMAAKNLNAEFNPTDSQKHTLACSQPTPMAVENSLNAEINPTDSQRHTHASSQPTPMAAENSLSTKINPTDFQRLTHACSQPTLMVAKISLNAEFNPTDSQRHTHACSQPTPMAAKNSLSAEINHTDSEKHTHPSSQPTLMAAKNSLNAEFNPTDEELILNYLRKKVNGESLPDDAVLECDLFGEKNPWDIWELFKDKSSNNGKDLYFFTKLKKKFGTGSRAVRTIGCGSWEGEDAPKSITANYEGNIQCIGSKKRYRFEKSKTEQDGRWIVHEFSLHSSLVFSKESGNNYVLCRFRKNIRNIQQKTARRRKEQEQEEAGKGMALGLQAITLKNDNNNDVVFEKNGKKRATMSDSTVEVDIGERKAKVAKSSIKIEFSMHSDTQELEDGACDSNTPWAMEFAQELLSTIDGDHKLEKERVCLIFNPFNKELLEDKYFFKPSSR